MTAAPTDPRHALVLFSGGQDSTACLAWALNRYARVETIGFDYGQRHRIELDCRHVVRTALAAQCPHWAARLGDDHLLDLRLLGQISDTALTSDRAIAFAANGLPNTFVPGRNLLFFNFAAAVAWRQLSDTIKTKTQMVSSTRTNERRPSENLVASPYTRSRTETS